MSFFQQLAQTTGFHQEAERLIKHVNRGQYEKAERQAAFLIQYDSLIQWLNVNLSAFQARPTEYPSGVARCFRILPIYMSAFECVMCFKESSILPDRAPSQLIESENADSVTPVGP